MVLPTGKGVQRDKRMASLPPRSRNNRGAVKAALPGRARTRIMFNGDPRGEVGAGCLWDGQPRPHTSLRPRLGIMATAMAFLAVACTSPIKPDAHFGNKPAVGTRESPPAGEWIDASVSHWAGEDQKRAGEVLRDSQPPPSRPQSPVRPPIRRSP